MMSDRSLKYSVVFPVGSEHLASRELCKQGKYLKVSGNLGDQGLKERDVACAEFPLLPSGFHPLSTP